MCQRANFVFLCWLLLLVTDIIDVESTVQNNYKNALDSANFEDNIHFQRLHSLPNNYKIAGSVLENDKNNTCHRDLNLLYEAFARQEQWALQMLDASSKIPAGLLMGNMLDLGMYDECIGVRGESQGIEIRGRHCMYNLAVVLGNVSLPLMLSICMPASCTGKDVVDLFNSSTNSNNSSQLPGVGITISSATCSSDQDVWDTEFIICFSLLIIFVGSLLVCTLCDVIHKRYRHPFLAILSQFSLTKSAASILNTQVKEGNLPAIHGIRFLSMAWIVLVHQYQIHGMSATVNGSDMMEWVQSWKSLYVVNASFAVDSFFALSGFLMTYVFLKQIPKQKKFNIPMYYLHRLTPAVIALLAIVIVFVPKIGSGAAWDKTMDAFVNGCRERWWHNVLYIHNFEEKPYKCLPHLWYLAVDMQLFWISPLILYPLYKHPKVGLLITGSLFFASLVIPATIVGIYKQRAFSMSQINQNNVTLNTNVFTDIVNTPYSRAGAWLVGIAFGFEVANKNRIISKPVIFMGWLLAVGAFTFCIFGTRSLMETDYEFNIVWEIAFAAFSRPLWAFGVSWIIYASIYNSAGVISRFLSWKLFQPLSRISYCIYLVHVIIQFMHAGGSRTANYFSDYYIWHDYLSNLVMCIVVSFIFSLIFESPILILEKLLFRRKQTS